MEAKYHTYKICQQYIVIFFTVEWLLMEWYFISGSKYFFGKRDGGSLRAFYVLVIFSHIDKSFGSSISDSSSSKCTLIFCSEIFVIVSAKTVFVPQSIFLNSALLGLVSPIR